MFTDRFLRSIEKISKPEEAQRFLRQDRYWVPEVAKPLLKRIDDLVNQCPQDALALAQIAVELVGRLRPPDRELQAHAWCSLATAERFAGKLEAAEAHFTKAEHFAIGAPAAIAAMIARQKALLLLDLHRTEHSLKLVREAVCLEKKAGLTASKSLLCEGVIHFTLGDHAGAERCFREVLELEEPGASVYLSAMQNLLPVVALRALTIEDLLAAEDFFRDVRGKLRGIRRTPVRYCVWHAEAILLYRQKEFRLAIEKLEQARTGYRELGWWFDFALASLDTVKATAKRESEARAREVLIECLGELEQASANKNIVEAFRLGLETESVEKAVVLIRQMLFGDAPKPA